jgi:pyrroloquinoline quinone (PQQ) biosynthesis protein C
LPLKAALTTSADRRIAGLVDEAHAHPAMRHPYLRKLETGDLPDVVGALKDFVHQYAAYSDAFRTYLDLTIAKLANPEHRESLMENLREENGHLPPEEIAALEQMGIRAEWVQDIPHPELFARVQRALGITEDWRAANTYCTEAVRWRDDVMNLISEGDSATAIGALGLGTENLVSLFYRPIVAAMDNHLTLSLEERVFFPLHCEVDDEHGRVLQQIAADLVAESEHGYHALRRGMLAALDLRSQFWTVLLARAEQMPSAT